MLATLCSFCLNVNAQSKQIPNSILRDHFISPPPSASPWVFWYWMQAAVSKEGITADLEAMKQVGIGGAYLMTIKGPANPPLMDSSLVQLTPQWWEMIKYAFKEAKRLNLKLGFHVSDGFALAGGPWITPELSMQKMVWTKKNVEGGKLSNVLLEQPETLEGYYKDIAVFAFPSPPGSGISTRTVSPKITSSKPDSAAQLLILPGNTKNFGCDEQCWVQYEFQQPFTCRSIIIKSRNNYQSNRLIVQKSDDGKNFQTVKRLDPPRHGWQDWDADYTHSFPATTAKYFRFVFDKEGSEPGAEDLDAAKWKPVLRVSGIELSSEAKIDQYEGKNGEVWRISKTTAAKEVPVNVCVPLKQIINITDQLDNNGRLTWNVPPGEWTILRMGHTSTGHKNETAGGGKGLECDKFNPDAVTLQFNSWFGECLKQIGPELKSVLQYFHVDSWECGSQNWSTVFRDEFKKRRSYDLLSYLPVVTGIPVQSVSESERFLHDLRQTIAELVKDNFYQTLSELARQSGVEFSGECVAPTMVSDGMLHYKNVDLPMGEFWLRSPTHDKPNDMLDAISGAHIYGKNIVQAEAFTELRMAWDEYPGMLKTLGDRNFAAGVNRFFFHVMVHNPWTDRKPGMTLDPIGLYFQRDQTWWKQNRAWIDYVKRCQTLLQLGKPVTDIAVFTGDEIPRRAILPDRLVNDLPGIFGKEIVEREKKRLANAGQPLRQMPAGVTHSANITDAADCIDPLNGYAYDSYNADALFNLTKIKNGAIVLSTGANYKLLIVPAPGKMSPNPLSKASREKLLQLAKEGGTVMMTSNVKAGNVIKTGKGKVIIGPYERSNFTSLGFAPDFIVKNAAGKKAEKIAWSHRTGDGFDIYFISNQKDSARVVDISLRVSRKIPEIWDPVTGEMHLAKKWKIKNGRTELPVYLDKNASLFIILLQNKKQVESNAGKNWDEPTTIMSLNDNWSVKFDPSLGGPGQTVKFDKLTDWTNHPDSNIRYYSGTAAYTKTINLQSNQSNKRVWLNIGNVGKIAEVFVNEISCGIVWTAPYRVDITKALKPGDNLIRVEVTNTWANRMIGDSRLPVEKRITNTMYPFNMEGKPLLSAGLLGPVVIEISN